MPFGKSVPKSLLFLLVLLILMMNLFVMNRWVPKVDGEIMSSYYVSPSGDDANPGTETQPFQSITKARDVVRTRKSNMTGDIIIWTRGGTYSINDTLAFDERDSGRNGYYVIYQNYPGEKPVISGGVKITGWVPWENGIYRAACGNLNFRQLYVNGNRAIRARTPNVGSCHRLISWNLENQTIRVKENELNTNWQNFSSDKVEIIIQQYWAESIMRIVSAVSNGVFKDITVNSTEKNIVFNRHWPEKSPNQSYHLENSYDFIDEGGEWYLDNNNSLHYIYYKPRPGEDMAKAQIIAPNVETLVSISGSGLETKANHIQFRGITLAHSNWLRPDSYGNLHLQAGQYSIENDQCERPKAGFLLKNADHITISGNMLTHMGATALDIYTGTGNILIEGNVLGDISGNGISIGKFSETGTAMATPYNPKDTREYCEYNTIAHNYIFKTGRDYYGAVGIAAGYVRYTSILYNELRDMPYTGISIGWGWTTTPCAMTNNTIQYNHVYGVMRQLCDGAGIYTLGYQPNSYIRYNYIHDLYRNPFAMPYPISCIYLDQGSKGFTVSGNCTTNAPEIIHYNGTRSFNIEGRNFTDNLDIINNNGLQPDYQNIRNNVAIGKPAIASSFLGQGFEADKVVDNDLRTGWGSNSQPADRRPWLQIDLGVAYPITSVEVVTRQDKNQPPTRCNFEIRASNSADFATYTVLGVVHKTALPYRSLLLADVYDATVYRYIRIVKTIDGPSFIAELRVFTGMLDK